MFSEIFRSPLEVKRPSGEIVELELDASAEPRLLEFDGVPVAIIRLADGGGANVRFDSKPASFSTFDTVMDGSGVSKEEFVRLVNAWRAKK